MKFKMADYADANPPYALKRHPELADVPTVIELAKTDADKAVMTFLSADIPISP